MLFPVTLASVVVAVAASILLVWSHRTSTRRREHIDTLMQNIEELERRIGRDAEVPVEPPVGSQSRLVEREVFSADALAGWTSHVGRMMAEASTPQDVVDRAVVLIYRRVDEAIKPSVLAAELNLSLRTLERAVARTFDCSPGQLIFAIKMREARRMLASGRVQVSQVAHRLAFSDAAYFSKRYKRFYRCPPSHHLSESSFIATN